MLKTVLLLNIFVETMIYVFSVFQQSSTEQSLFGMEIFWDIINVFMVIFD